MSRILTGIQATGTPHLGNILGAIVPAIELSKKTENESFLFIANMHTLTQIKDAEVLKKKHLRNRCGVAGVWAGYRENLFLQTKRYPRNLRAFLVFVLFFSLPKAYFGSLVQG